MQETPYCTNLCPPLRGLFLLLLILDNSVVGTRYWGDGADCGDHAFVHLTNLTVLTLLHQFKENFLGLRGKRRVKANDIASALNSWSVELRP